MKGVLNLKGGFLQKLYVTNRFGKIQGTSTKMMASLVKMMRAPCSFLTKN